MYIKSTKVWLAGSFHPATLHLEDKKILDILPYDFEVCDQDYGHLRIVPGFIDIHCHGAYGYDTNYAQEEGLKQWAKKIVKEGVTGFLSTTITELNPVLTKAVQNVRHVKETHVAGRDGADILGIHFEGPYLDMKYKGAQPPEAIVQGTIEEFKHYQKESGNLIKVITMAPEHDPDYALTKYASQHGVVVSVGHSGATYNEALLAFANGAMSVTHTFNGQSPFNHRANGVAGAALRLRNVYSEIICDGQHCTPEALNIFFQTKGSHYGVMISDALMAKGLPKGTKFQFGGHEVQIDQNGLAHLTETGGIAGSTLSLNNGLRILVEEALVPFETAINSCTLNPATLLGMDDHLGKIVAGYDADLVMLGDDYSVVETYCKGIKQ